MEERIDCTALQEDLSALLDGELSPEREAELRAHLETCAACAEVLASFEQANRSLDELPMPPVPGDLFARLQAKIELEEAKAKPGRRAPLRRRTWSMRAAGLVVAAAAALLLLLVTKDDKPTGPPESPTEIIAKKEELPEDSGEVVKEEPQEVVANSTDSTEPEDLESLSDEELFLVMEMETLDDLEILEQLELFEKMAERDWSERKEERS